MLSVQTLMQEVKMPGRQRTRMRGKEERRMMAVALDDLPELDRLVLSLRYYESVRPNQIAGALGLPEDEVRRVLAEALRRILEINRGRSGLGETKARRPRGESAGGRQGKGRSV